MKCIEKWYIEHLRKMWGATNMVPYNFLFLEILPFFLKFHSWELLLWNKGWADHLWVQTLAKEIYSSCRYKLIKISIVLCNILNLLQSTEPIRGLLLADQNVSDCSHISWFMMRGEWRWAKCRVNLWPKAQSRACWLQKSTSNLLWLELEY